jgi:hypothetical protein
LIDTEHNGTETQPRRERDPHPADQHEAFAKVTLRRGVNAGRSVESNRRG